MTPYSFTELVYAVELLKTCMQDEQNLPRFGQGEFIPCAVSWNVLTNFAHMPESSTVHPHQSLSVNRSDVPYTEGQDFRLEEINQQV